MAKFCMKCGATLEENIKFCKACGTPVDGIAKNTVQRQAVNETSSRNTTVRQTKATSVKSRGASNWLIVALAIVIIALGGGGFYLYHARQAAVPVSSSEPTGEKETDATSSLVDNAEVNKDKKVTTSSQVSETPMDKAIAELGEYGIGGKNNFVSTTYGHSSDGFIAVTDSGMVAVVDRKNHRAGMVKPRLNLKQFQAQAKEKFSQPMIMDCTFENETRDNDGNAGYWRGNTHFMSIYAVYEFDNNGNIIPGMLTTGRGENPSHFQEVLYEPKNVDFANLFLTEAFSVKL